MFSYARRESKDARKSESNLSSILPNGHSQAISGISGCRNMHAANPKNQ
jgi:hypothetical protein